MGILGDHGSHEDVIGVRGEVGSDFSLVLTISGAIFNGLPSIVDWVFHENFVGVDANVLLLIRLGVGGLGIRLKLNVGLHWRSLVGHGGGVFSIIDLVELVVFVTDDGAELPDFLVLSVKLNGRLVWWSGVSLLGGVVTVGLLDVGVHSVFLHGLEAPDWLGSGSEAKKAGSSK